MEGEGCFWVRKKDSMLFLSLTQSSKDSALMKCIVDFINDLPRIGGNDDLSINSADLSEQSSALPKSSNPSGVRLETQVIPGKTSIIRLVINQHEFIQKVVIPFWDNLA